MAWRQDSAAAFSGGSGQMAVIAELLQRRCNAAIPHIDIGTDVFAFRDDREEVARLQVKTETGKRYRKGGYAAKFGIPLKQLKRNDAPPLFYALAVRLNERWAAFLIISRSVLKDLWNEGLGSENLHSGNLEFHVQFREERVAGTGEAGQTTRLTARCGKEATRMFDLTKYLNAWESLPPLQPLVEWEATEPSPTGQGSAQRGDGGPGKPQP
jgi:hypothetical protein